VICKAFPFIVLTSNAERELPAPFLRRCLRLDIKEPDDIRLAKIVEAHFGDTDEKGTEERNQLIELFLKRRTKGGLATDQLLNAVYLTTQGIDLKDKNTLIETVLKYLRTMGTV
jgi:MoxR-like ATPase